MPANAEQVVTPEPQPDKRSIDTGQPRTIPAGEFKAKCLKLMDEVAETREPIIITKFGKPVAQMIPIEEKRVELFGAMRGTVLWEGDIISPLGEDAWGWFAEP
jgi:prevent-host-death family protein